MRSCNHRKVAHRSCAQCSLEIKSRLLIASKKCASNHHVRTYTEDLCDSCYKTFEVKEESCIHKQGTNIRCDGCVGTSDFCKHYSTEKVRKLTPVAFSLTVIDTIEDKLDEKCSLAYSGKDTMKIFFESIEKVYYILAEKHSDRMQKYKKLTSKDGNTKKLIEEIRSKNKKCWVCNTELRFSNRYVDHCHTTGIFPKLLKSRNLL